MGVLFNFSKPQVLASQSFLSFFRLRRISPLIFADDTVSVFLFSGCFAFWFKMNLLKIGDNSLLLPHPSLHVPVAKIPSGSPFS